MSIPVTDTQAHSSPMIISANGDSLLSYARFVGQLVKDMGDFKQNFHHMATGISGEAGELLDASKKHWVYGKELDMENVKEELGDILFYLQGALILTGLTYDDIISANYEKLEERYAGAYSDEAAIARADKVAPPLTLVFTTSAAPANIIQSLDTALTTGKIS
jgi:NTP pyrophosphatase (non-canonical NTP hydrolase)